jgi:hypothetical protein
MLFGLIVVIQYRFIIAGMNQFYRLLIGKYIRLSIIHHDNSFAFVPTQLIDFS